MKKIIKAIKRLWKIGTCTHWNGGRCYEFNDTTKLTICKGCGLVTEIVFSESNEKEGTKYTGIAK